MIDTVMVLCRFYQQPCGTDCNRQLVWLL